MSSQLVWLITGTSSGLGRQLALEALSRGEKVIATGRGRSISKLEDLRASGADVLELDVTSPLEALHEVAKKAVAIHGRIDVLVNNAGYILVGALEESTPQETLDQFNTNVFGALNVARAFLPYMREKKTGTVVWIGSVGGWRHAPYAGLYCATKWTLRAISAALHDEISPLGLRSTCLDFGYFRTSFLAADQRAPEVSRIPDYAAISQQMEQSLQGEQYEAHYHNRCGSLFKLLQNIMASVRVIVDVVRGEGDAAGKPFPTSLVLGSDALGIAKTVSSAALTHLDEWQAVSVSTDFRD